MDTLTMDNWQSFFLVLLAICAFVVLLGNTIKTIKEWKRPSLSVDERLRRDHERLTKLEEQSVEMQEEINLILRSVLALVNHEITGNGVEKLKETQIEIQKYLINRR